MRAARQVSVHFAFTDCANQEKVGGMIGERSKLKGRDKVREDEIEVV
jgi:hypothetical protein